MSEDSQRGRVRGVSSQLNVLLLRAITAVVLLLVFGGLAYLVYVEQIEPDALLLYTGVLVGYFVHAMKDVL